MYTNNLTVKQQADNAIKWIDSLPDYKQAHVSNRGRLGGPRLGYCCLSAGCVILDVNFNVDDHTSPNLVLKVGLVDDTGTFSNGIYYGADCLTSINDATKAGFKRISTLMKRKPQLMFKHEVVILINNHYKNQIV